MRKALRFVLGAVVLRVICLLAIAWAAGALYFDFPFASLRAPLALIYFSVSLAALIFVKPRWRALAFVAAGFLVVVAWWFTLKPGATIAPGSPMSPQPRGPRFNGDEVTLHNVRNCDYRTETDYTPRWETRTVRTFANHRRRSRHQLLGLALDRASHRQLPVRRRAAGLLFHRDAQDKSAKATPPSAASTGSSS